jgi:thioester reductase-like protein
MMFVTGATGLVGGAIVLELLRRDEEGPPVFCLVRGESHAAATERLHASLRAAAALYDAELSEEALRERCVAVVGDITAPECGVEPGGLAEVDELWHCAASLKFAEADRAEIESHNLDGTANVLELAKRLGVRRCNHVSTAYVVGTQTGPIGEEPVRVDRTPNNVYEETKGVAEGMVEAAGFEVCRIARPTIVVAHSRTGRCASDTGIYGFVDQMRRFKKLVSRRLGDYLVHRSIAVVGHPGTRLNLIPVDVVATAMLELSERQAPSGIYHVASLDPPRLEQALAVLMEVLGMRVPRYVEREEQLNSIDAAFNRGAAFHRAYLLQDKDFDCANAIEICGEDLFRTGLDTDELIRFAHAYLELSDGSRRRRPRAAPMAEASSADGSAR